MSVSDISRQVDSNVLLVDKKQKHKEDERNYYKRGSTRVRFYNRDTGRPY